MKKWRVFAEVKAVAYIDVVAKSESDAREIAESQIPEEWTIEEWDRIDLSKPMDLGKPSEAELTELPSLELTQ